ncbi:MAG TPA: enoyl-CoA hydratase-related protein [Candidatus Limnocylindrales bacterium]|nr:enoyl-CoA hydratase-related protein [Candidatus Limnocylindrales bacterium]
MTEAAPAQAPTNSGGTRVQTAFPARGSAGDTLDGVALVTFDRQEALNALSFDLLDEIADTLARLDKDEACRAIVLTGAGTRAFAAGADIKELSIQTPVTLTVENRFAVWDRIGAVRTPTIAAVRGFALGGGCELAMSCDMIVAAEDAQFGQPEIKLGVIPGAGGTQRLTRAIGKARAMELILTGRNMTAPEADAAGLLTKVVAPDETLNAALDLAARIAAQAPVAVQQAKQAILRAHELSLSAGLDFERRAFFLLFATDDQSEGMQAFTEKRPPNWNGR